jgi:tetratricopeptide (TPR) repeat protein
VNRDSLAHARQEATKHSQDSARDARQHHTDSLTAARKKTADSLEAARKYKSSKHYQDSVSKTRTAKADSIKNARTAAIKAQTAARKKVTDSLAAIRKYHDSKHYRDSVAKSRQRHMDEIKAVQKAHMDSLKLARKISTDSAMAVRKAHTDSLKKIQTERSEKMAAIRKYRESKRYKDSVAIIKQARLDSIRIARKAFSDSLAVVRKANAENLKEMRKHMTDSIAAVRKKSMDSLKLVRKTRTDSLTKVREKKEKVAKDKQKANENKLDLALKLKIEKKHKAWSNESMLKKRWGVPRREIQNTFTRYNYYFNADRKMDEALLNMSRVRKENYDSLIALFPFNPDRDSSSIAPDMDSIIHKVSVGIQIHDPRTKWGDDLYLLLGEAYYYKGDYQNAIIAFRYTVSIYEQNKKKPKESKTNKGEGPSILEEDKKSILDFLKHQSVHNEAILWLARTFTQINQVGNAESVLDLVEADPNFPKSLVGRLALEKAFVKLKQGDLKAASAQLSLAAADNNLSDMQRERCAYLAGQIFELRNEDSAAIANYEQTLDLHPKIDLDFYAHKHEAYAVMASGMDPKSTVSTLKGMLKDGKYAPYYEQIYYILGLLAIKSNNNAEAITYLEKGIKAPKATKKQKAISFAHLGTIYYAREDYINAKHAYDSAAAFSKYAGDDDEVALALRRAPVLGDIAGPVGIIHTQDSLMALASLSDREQKLAVRRYIKMLEDRRADSIYRAENSGVQAAEQAGNNGEEQIATWYFSNPQQLQQGYNDFKRKWGNRPLTDNWRRIASVGFVSNANPTDNNVAAVDSGGAELDVDENGIPTEESLLAMIPNTDQQKDRAKRLEQRAYIDLANAYIRQLEDYPPALKAMDTLDVRYPQHEHKAQELYLRYLVALRQNRMDEARGMGAQLLKLYPGSQYAELVRPSTEDNASAKEDNESIQTYYDQTYSLLQQRQYTEVLQRVRVARKKYASPRYNGKLTILEASALVGQGEYKPADTMLREFMKVNTSDSLHDWAEAVLKYIDRNKPKELPPAPMADSAKKTANNIPAMPSDTMAVKRANNVKPNPDMANAIRMSPPDKYTYKPQDEHYCIFVFPGYEARSMGVKAAITDFNTFKYTDKKLTVTIDMLNAGLGVLVIKKFPNANEAKAYMNALKATTQIFREYKPTDYKVLIISSINYLKLLADKSDGPYSVFYAENYK